MEVTQELPSLEQETLQSEQLPSGNKVIFSKVQDPGGLTSSEFP